MVPRSSPPCAPRLLTPPSASKTASMPTALASSMITLFGRPIRTMRSEPRDWREWRRSAMDSMRKEKYGWVKQKRWVQIEFPHTQKNNSISIKKENSNPTSKSSTLINTVEIFHQL
ncbi:hypothetical protein MRB53_027362 [Persea americana]|uniref:Uncharacterized protein n=1 Tax=Persea americana TaxID=3435 RepID=A0ACC2LLY2_PERAE|nr:hypothetical protein MRB53_027362 [Persea americana]